MVYMNADRLQFYKSGIMKGSACSDTRPNHAVLLVGYNTIDNYWLIKNSWCGGGIVMAVRRQTPHAVMWPPKISGASVGMPLLDTSARAQQGSTCGEHGWVLQPLLALLPVADRAAGLGKPAAPRVPLLRALRGRQAEPQTGMLRSGERSHRPQWGAAALHSVPVPVPPRKHMHTMCHTYTTQGLRWQPTVGLGPRALQATVAAMARPVSSKGLAM